MLQTTRSGRRSTSGARLLLRLHIVVLVLVECVLHRVPLCITRARQGGVCLLILLDELVGLIQLIFQHLYLERVFHPEVFRQFLSELLFPQSHTASLCQQNLRLEKLHIPAAIF